MIFTEPGSLPRNISAKPRVIQLSELRLKRASVLANQLFDLGELIIELETFLVGQRVRRLDNLARHDLLDRKLHLLEVDSRLQIDKSAKFRIIRQENQNLQVSRVSQRHISARSAFRRPPRSRS